MLFFTGVLATLIIGPLVFRLFSLRQPKGQRFPKTAKGLIGDILVLPAFNGLALQIGLIENFPASQLLLISLLVTAVVSIWYYRWRSKRQGARDWLVKDTGGFTQTGWYHFVYFGLQIFLIAVSVLTFPTNFILWGLLALYGLMAFAFVKK